MEEELAASISDSLATVTLFGHRAARVALSRRIQKVAVRFRKLTQGTAEEPETYDTAPADAHVRQAAFDANSLGFRIPRKARLPGACVTAGRGRMITRTGSHIRHLCSRN